MLSLDWSFTKKKTYPSVLPSAGSELSGGEQSTRLVSCLGEGASLAKEVAESKEIDEWMIRRGIEGAGEEGY